EHEHEHEHHHEHGGHCTCGCHDHGHHHADDVFTSWGIETAARYSKEQIEAILNEFTESSEYGTVLRSKGVLEAEDGSWIHFDYVPGESDVRSGKASVIGRICVIGADLKTEKLAELFGAKGV
ncbi:MAG: GTP-binding protein, partial [Clostridia bacterium]|nr:GTP-binding protein [Clostridia bacterium]